MSSKILIAEIAINGTIISVPDFQLSALVMLQTDSSLQFFCCSEYFDETAQIYRGLKMS